MALIYEKCRDETEKLQYIKSFKTVQTLFATHFHEITEIVYLESGKIETTINGTTFTAEERDTSQIIAALLQAGANPHAYYKNARALDYAENNPVLQNTPAIQILKDAMFNWQTPTAY